MNGSEIGRCHKLREEGGETTLNVQTSEDPYIILEIHAGKESSSKDVLNIASVHNKANTYLKSQNFRPSSPAVTKVFTFSLLTDGAHDTVLMGADSAVTHIKGFEPVYQQNA
jgi:uncharacterized protein YukJ